MASQEMDKAVVMEVQQEQDNQQHTTSTAAAGVVDSNLDEVVSIELPAPQGWTKKFIPKKGGTGTPRRNEIVFIAPTGEEIKNKRQLDQYLKSHTDGPPSSDFDWGTGDTPRRSARLSSKPTATESSESGGSSRKRQRKPSSKKKETGGGESGEDEAPANKTEDEKDVEMKDAEGAGNEAAVEKTEEEAHEDAGLAKSSDGTAEERADEAKEQKEGDVGLSGGSRTQPDENKPEEVPSQETFKVPEVTNKEEQSQVHKVETAQDITVPTKGKEKHEENKVGPVQEIVEQPEENKPEAVEKPLEAELPSDANNAMEVEPAGKGVIEEKAVNEGGPSNAENETEESKLVPEESVKMATSEDAGPGRNGGQENQEASLQTENQPVDPEPGAAQPISC